ncbi:MAG: 3-dehydroquinate synthase [Gammaproteobacteria bacterium]|jgi:3-dehydroquinate synthase
MNKITVELGSRSYPIFIGQGILEKSEYYSDLLNTQQVMIVTDSVVEKLYLTQVMEALQGVQVITHILPVGEDQKNLESMNQIVTLLLNNKFNRTCCLIALGGGVIGDLTGFSAACYQRGVKFLQIPTTLLAQVDSSVGGKTAVNHKAGKNMIGAFHQPVGVITDVNVLQSLPDRELSAGLAEVIKYGLIRDYEFFQWLEDNIDDLKNRQYDALSFAIKRSCINKAEVVAIDETEKGLRATLNLGHTFGHAIETGLNYKRWLHGEAVAMGMIMASHMSFLQGWLNKDDMNRIQKLIAKAGLPKKLPDELLGTNLRELMSVDKKASHGKIKLVLLKSIGEAIVTDSFQESYLQETISHFYNKD